MKPNPNESERLAPGFRVRINGAELPVQAQADLFEVAVYEDVQAPGMFALRLINEDRTQSLCTWADDDLTAEGNEVEIWMGYSDHLEPLMVGEITGLEPEFSAIGVSTLTVRGYDRRHRLLRGRKTHSFVQMKDSEIASQIAGDAGLTARVEDTQVTLEYVLQHNQSDLEFLWDRARRIGYEVVVEDKTLYFRLRPTASAEVLTLTLQGDLLEFSPRLTTMGQVGQVTVRGWSAKDKDTVVGRAATGDETTTMDGSTSGPSIADQAFGVAHAGSVDRPVLSQAEADLVALGRFNELALAYVSGEGLCIGRTDLRAGTVIRIEGLGRRFSGLYYVTATRHAYTPETGYRTAITVKRNAT